MRRKKLARRIGTIMLCAAMLVQSTLVVGATEGMDEPIAPDGPVIEDPVDPEIPGPIDPDGPGGENPADIGDDVDEMVEEFDIDTSALCGYREVSSDKIITPGAVMTDPDYVSDQIEELSLERKYDPFASRSLPAVRNQNPYGTCYAFSVVGLADVQAYKQGRASDFSEAQFAYFNWHAVQDPLGGITGDVNFKPDDDWTEGGNTIFSQRVLANWVGAVDESTMPYTNMSSWESKSAIPSIANSISKDTMHLQNVRVYSLANSSDIPLIKSAIKTNGGVSVSYFDSGKYYNETNNCFYNWEAASSNHAVMIVGWDDDFSKTKFNAGHQPTNNGAWLIRNSWGHDGYSHYGYFWISYEDVGLTQHIDGTTAGRAYVFDFDPVGIYANNYQYDGGIVDSYISSYSSDSIKTANMFTAKNSDPIRAVSFATDSVAVQYVVNVYTGCTSTNPESGTLRSTVSGTTGAMGYYTIDLPSAVSIAQGTRFSVVVTLSKVGGSEIRIQTEESIPYPDWWYNSTTVAHAGESFKWDSYSSVWSDYGVAYNRNIRIKAFTGGSGRAGVPATGIRLNKTTCKLDMGKTEQLVATLTPSNSTSEVRYTSSNPAVATVGLGGNVNGVAEGTCVITATANGHSASCTVTVENNTPPTHITLVLPKTEIAIGEKLAASVTLEPSNAKAKVYYESIDEDVATIDANGVITGISKGSAWVHAYVKLERYNLYSQWTVVNVTDSAPGPGPGPDPDMPFIDVPTGAYFYEPVKWAYSHNITTGVSNSEFGPNNTCTRGQVVTFLWRAVGSPEPHSTSCKFVDVKPGSYYYKPVLWAVENGVTTGTSPTTFSPNGTVTRGQTVTFMWRAYGMPGAPSSGRFADVPGNAYFARAVDWAVANGITTGTSSSTFSPNGNCIRGQIVTFLYRGYK